MSYWTNRDFVEPIQNGNNSCELPSFQIVKEGRGHHKEIECNIGGLIAANDIVNISVDPQHTSEFLRQIKSYKFTSARQALAIMEIIENSFLNLSEEEKNEIDSIIINAELEKLPIDSFYFTANALIRATRHLEIDCSGGAVNGGIYITDPLSGNEIFSGYYNFRYNRFHDKEQNIVMMKVLYEWRGNNGEKEELITKLFSLK